MPLKVRCPGCEKVLNVPDAARGKAVRCPKCETKVKIPAATKKRRVRQTAPDSADDLLNLNLREAEDAHARICPACGAAAAIEDINCTECGVDLITGQIAEKESARRRSGAPDPALYYRAAWVESWKFMKRYKGLAGRTFVYWILFSFLLAGCLFMVDFCERTPPKMFWVAFSIIAGMVYPGWLWSLTMKVIVATAAKKKSLDRINFDIFLNIALGFKWCLWAIAFFTPAVVFAAPLLLLDVRAYWGGLAMTVLLTLAVVPTALGHMAMPITWKAWLSPILFQVTFQHIGHSAWWVLMLLTVLAVCFSPLAIAGGVYHAEVTALMQGEFIASPTTFYGIIGGAAAASHLLLGFGALILMRATGLFVYYNKSTLELITRVEEQKYVPKGTRLDDIESMQEGPSAKGVAIGAGLAFVFGAVFGLIFGLVSTETSVLSGIGSGILMAGLLVALTGRIMILIASFNDSVIWGVIVLWVPFGEFAYLAMNFNDAKWPVAIQFIGGFYLAIGFVLSLM
ncbi:hypothetical protein CA54_32960 [Symmachiella macrocystis]|uniref:Double zinc ribbon n=1 Tax=Symmachiella macrocystis TaxID=2527985 RepID=A0A5C6BQD6_9PLAN|nr:hypothetical protein [Symmachiella macrocystis]TWU14450.1 hypothetical protein CA54_32960 [Symmachiella macrocystis]